MLRPCYETTVDSACPLLGRMNTLLAHCIPVLQALHPLCRLTDAGQPSVEHVRGMFAAMEGPSGARALGHMSEEEDAEYAAKQPSSQVGSLPDVRPEHCGACAACSPLCYMSKSGGG